MAVQHQGVEGAVSSDRTSSSLDSESRANWTSIAPLARPSEGWWDIVRVFDCFLADDAHARTQNFEVCSLVRWCAPHLAPIRPD